MGAENPFEVEIKEPGIMNEDLADLIRSRVPGTSCRAIYMEAFADSEPTMSMDEFRELFNRVVSEPVEAERDDELD